MIKQDNIKKRAIFVSSISGFIAALSSAVGLGNIWRFPTMVGENGGGAFIFVYLICVMLLGIPIMIAEFFIGRKTRTNAIGAFDKFKASSFWKVIGYLGVISTLFISFFYSTVAGWVYSYVYKAFSGKFSFIRNLEMGLAKSFVNEEFTRTVDVNLYPMLWQGLAIFVVAFILIQGVNKGIEKITRILMPILFVIILLIVFRSITLSGASEGIKFLFKIDFTKITKPVILSALGLSFFKLSIGLGTMITYGSYFTDDNNMINTSMKVAVSDTIVSMLIGIAIFPAVFTFNLEPGSGPGLLFNTIPLIFSKMPFGNILLVLFFLLTAFAATMAMMSMVEVSVTFLSEEFKFKRKNAVIIISTLIFLVGSLTTHSKSVFGSVSIYGKNFFDFFDYMSSNIFLPIGGLLIAVFVGYFVKKEDLYFELSNKGTLDNTRTIKIFNFIIKFLTPVLIVIVFLNIFNII